MRLERRVEKLESRSLGGQRIHILLPWRPIPNDISDDDIVLKVNFVSVKERQ